MVPLPGQSRPLSTDAEDVYGPLLGVPSLPKLRGPVDGVCSPEDRCEASGHLVRAWAPWCWLAAYSALSVLLADGFVHMTGIFLVFSGWIAGRMLLQHLVSAMNPRSPLEAQRPFLEFVLRGQPRALQLLCVAQALSFQAQALRPGSPPE